MLCAVLLCALAARAGAELLHDNPQRLDAAEPVTRSVSGAFRGSWMLSRKGRRFEAYRGIRYAQPPVGELRFQPPQMIQNYSAEVDATKDGPSCPQPMMNNYPVDEDCLSINVYKPGGNIATPLPVVLYIHAGGLYSTNGRSDLVGPNYLLDRDLVFVTINYRLGTLGFLSTGDKYAPGNNGFKDQVAALRWVQRNIAAFGGDPNLVTLAGYGAGSLSVALHMISPMSKGLFHRAISSSASPFSQITIPRHQRDLAVRLTEKRLGVTEIDCPTDTNKALVDCLKTRSWQELGDSLHIMFIFDNDPELIWLPVQEEDFGQERFLPRQPLDALCGGDLHAVPYIVGQTQDEFTRKVFEIFDSKPYTLQDFKDKWRSMARTAFFLPEGAAGDQAADRLKQVYLAGKDIEHDNFTRDALGRLFSDAEVGFGVHRLVNLMARHSPKAVYYYEYGYIGNGSYYKNPFSDKPTLASHHDDLIYLFNASYFFPSLPPSDSQDSLMVDKMTAIWYNFARYGDPNPKPDTPELSTLSWPPFKSDDRKYLRIDNPFSLHQNLFEDRFKVWEELFPLDYQKCK